jgi:hypothetical protein
MHTHPSKITLDRVSATYAAGQTREAYALADAAWKMVLEIPGAGEDASLVESWYGLLMAVEGGRVGEGLSHCRNAVKVMFWDASVHEHLARVEIAAGQRKEALATIARGLSLAPENRELRGLRASLGVRRRPVVPFLERSNPINRWMGLLSQNPSD